MLVTDFHPHEPVRRCKMLLETGPVGKIGILRLDTVSGWKLPPAGILAEYIQPKGEEHLRMGE